MASGPHRIDVHHHIVPPDYVSALAKIGIADAGGRPFPRWDAKSTLAFMDRNGIATAIASISSPGVYFGDGGFARDLARRCNDRLARLVSDHPQRFGAFAVLPLPDVQAALREAEYALDALRLDGVGLLASIGERYLGDSEFDELYAELNRRQAVVFIHPTVPPGSKLAKLDMPGFLVDFVFDTTRAVAHLLYTGTLERYPDIRFILSHAGGTIPYVAWRISLMELNPTIRERVPQGVITYLKRLYYDTALSAAPYSLRSLQELVDTSQILFGSDYEFAPEPLTVASIAGLQAYDGFNEPTRMAIERDNAVALFPRLKQP